MKLQEIRESALALPRRSRERLVKELTQSLQGDTFLVRPPGILSEDDPNWDEVLNKRIEAYEQGKDKGVTWEEIRAEWSAELNARKISKRR